MRVCVCAHMLATSVMSDALHLCGCELQYESVCEHTVVTSVVSDPLHPRGLWIAV